MSGVWHFLLAGTVAGTVSGEIAAAKTRKLSLSLWGPSQVTFDMPGDHPQALQINDLRSDLFVMRDGEWLFKGRLGASQDKLNAGDHTSSFTAVDYRGMLDRRVIWPSSRQAFSATEQAEIAWALIADTQALSDLGIWRIPPLGGSDTLVPTGITRTMTFPAGQKIGEAISSIALQTSGFDWDISGQGQFQLFYPRRDRYQSSTPPTAAYGREITAVDRTVAGTTFANALYYTGAQGLTPVTVVAGDTTTYGRFESAIGNTNLKDQASVGAAAGLELAVDDNLQPAYTFTFAPGYWSPDLYWLGDTVRIFVKAGRLNINQTIRITGIDITLDDAGGETVALTFAAAPAALAQAAGAGGGSAGVAPMPAPAATTPTRGGVALPATSHLSLPNSLNNLNGRLGTLERTVGQAPAAPPAGSGVPPGGTAGQILDKKSNADYDTQWQTVPGVSLIGGGIDNASPGSVNVALATLGTFYIIPWSGATVLFDSGSVVDALNFRLRVPADGLYAVNFNPQVGSGNAVGQYQIQANIYNSGGTVLTQQGLQFFLSPVTGIGSNNWYQFQTMFFAARATNYFALSAARVYGGLAADYAGVNMFQIIWVAPHP